MRPILLTLAALALSLTPAIAQQGPGVVAFVEHTEGKIQVKEAGGATHPVQKWDPLHLNDTVIVPKGGSLVVRFQNGTRTITAATPTADRKIHPLVGASNDTNTRVLRAIFDSGRRAFSKASENARTGTRTTEHVLIEIPKIEALLPSGSTLGQTIRFRWFQDKPSMVTLTLTDAAGNVVWTRDQQSGSSLEYPATETPLKPGEEYTWTIQSGDDRSTNKFTIAGPDEVKAVTGAISGMRSVKFADVEGRVLARVAVLLDQELYTDAIEELHQLPAGRVSPMVKAITADAWHKMGETYMESLTLRELSQSDPLIVRWDQDKASSGGPE